jgi:hypothetical protein
MMLQFLIIERISVINSVGAPNSSKNSVISNIIEIRPNFKENISTVKADA